MTVRYDKQDQRADTLRPQVWEMLQFLKEPNNVDHVALAGDAETILGTVLVATSAGTWTRRGTRSRWPRSASRT
jgi:hypothetical protein